MNRNKTPSEIQKTHTHTHTKPSHSILTCNIRCWKRTHDVTTSQFLVPATYNTRTVTDAPRVLEELFAKFRNLTVTTLTETPAPY